MNKDFKTIALIPESYKPKGNYLPRERILQAKVARAVSTVSSQHPYYLVSVSPKSTNMPPKFLNTTTQMSKTTATVKQSTGLKFPTLICLSVEALAKTLASLASELELREREVDLFGNTSVVLKKKNHDILYLKMLKDNGCIP